MPVAGRKEMDTVREITNELAITGQPTFDELQQLAEDGYRSVVNLRSPDETGFLEEERQKIEYLGLRYVNLPIQIRNLNLDHLIPVIQTLVSLPKPTLVHCDNGIRSSIVVLVQIAIEQGIGAEDALQRVEKLGLLSD